MSLEDILSAPIQTESQDAAPEESLAETQELDNETGDPSHQGDQSEVLEETELEQEVDTSVEDNTDDDIDIPFHKHPRFKSLVDEKNSYKRELEELRHMVEEMQYQSQAQADNVNEPIPDWFVEQYGHDEALYAEYSQRVQSYEESIINKAVDRVRAAETESQNQQEDLLHWVDEQMDGLSEEVGGLSQDDRHEIMKVAYDYKPTTDEGDLDFGAAYDIWSMEKARQQAEESQKIEARKQVASQVASPESSPSSNQKQKIFTPADFRRRW